MSVAVTALVVRLRATNKNRKLGYYGAARQSDHLKKTSERSEQGTILRRNKKNPRDFDSVQHHYVLKSRR